MSSATTRRRRPCPSSGRSTRHYLEPLRQRLSKLGRVGRAWPAAASPPSLEDHATILRRFRRFFPHNEPRRIAHGPTFASKPGDVWPSDGGLHQYHADDPAQSSLLPLEYLPSGWKQLVELLSWAERCDERLDAAIGRLNEPAEP